MENASKSDVFLKYLKNEHMDPNISIYRYNLLLKSNIFTNFQGKISRQFFINWKGDGTIRAYFGPPILAKTKVICKDKNPMILNS